MSESDLYFVFQQFQNHITKKTLFSLAFFLFRLSIRIIFHHSSLFVFHFNLLSTELSLEASHLYKSKKKEDTKHTRRTQHVMIKFFCHTTK